MGNIHILRGMKRIPGGMMIIPLFLGCLVKTFFPGLLSIGGFTTGLLTGTITIVGMFLFCSGATIKINQAGIPLYKGIMLLTIKVSIGIGLGFTLNHFFGPAGVFGITPFAMIAAMTNKNGTLYATLAGEFGDSTDVGALALILLSDGPFFTLIAMGLSGMASIPLMAVVACFLPLIGGFILGTLDDDFGQMLSGGIPLLTPFAGFALGTGMSLFTVVQGGAQGIVLGLMTIILTGLGTYFIYSLINRVVLKKKRSPLGAAVGTVGGNAVATPAVLALADPSLAGIAPMVAAQISGAVIITAFLCPLLTTILVKRDRRLTLQEEKESSTELSVEEKS